MLTSAIQLDSRPLSNFVKTVIWLQIKPKGPILSRMKPFLACP